MTRDTNYITTLIGVNSSMIIQQMMMTFIMFFQKMLVWHCCLHACVVCVDVAWVVGLLSFSLCYSLFLSLSVCYSPSLYSQWCSEPLTHIVQSLPHIALVSSHSTAPYHITRNSTQSHFLAVLLSNLLWCVKVRLLSLSISTGLGVSGCKEGTFCVVDTRRATMVKQR